jgi:hypothetical protein
MHANDEISEEMFKWILGEIIGKTSKTVGEININN